QRPAGKNDFVPRPDSLFSSVLDVLDTDGALFLKQDARDDGVGDDREVRPAPRRFQICGFSAATLAVLDALLQITDTFEFSSVVILVLRNSRLHACLDVGVG